MTVFTLSGRKTWRQVRLLIVAAAGWSLAFAGSGEPVLIVPACRVTLIDHVMLAGERSGVLDEVSVQAGDAIESGQVLASLRCRSARNALLIAEKEAGNDIEWRYARKAGELSRVEYEKAVQLNRDIPGSHSELDLQRLQLAAERSVLQAEEAAFHREVAAVRRDAARDELSAFQIMAPFDGVVLRVHKDAGEAIHEADDVLEVARFDRMRVEGNVRLADGWRVRVGQPVVVQVTVAEAELPVEDVSFRGRITFVDQRVHEVSQLVRVWAEIENPNGLLKDGLQAEMLIDTGRE